MSSLSDHSCALFWNIYSLCSSLILIDKVSVSTLTKSVPQSVCVWMWDCPRQFVYFLVVASLTSSSLACFCLKTYSHYTDYSAWKQAVEHSPLLQFAVSQGPYSVAECSAVIVRFLFTIFEEGAVSVPLSLQMLITPKKHCALHIRVCWLKWKHYSVSDLLQIICSAVIVTALSVLSYPTFKGQSHSFISVQQDGQNPCILHCHPKIEYQTAWDVIKVIQSFCGVTLRQCHTTKWWYDTMKYWDSTSFCATQF